MYMVLKMSLNSNHSALWQTPIVVLHVFWSNWHRYFYKPDTLPVSQPMASKHLWNDHTHTHTHPFNGPLSGTTQVSHYQKGKTNLGFTGARDSEWQWHQLGHMQVCTSLQTDNHASTPPLSFFTGRMPFLPPNQQRQSTEGIHLWNDQRTVIYNVYCGDVCVYFVQRNSQMNLCVSMENNTLLLGMCFSVFMSLLNFQHCHDTVKLHCMRNSFLLQILGLRIVSGVLCVSLIVVSLYCCILKVIDDRGYWLTVVTVCVCSTVLMLLKMVVEYSQLTSDIPSAAPEILNRLIELLKVLFCVINF